MKKVNQLLLLFVTATLFVGCFGGSAPKDVAKSFADAIAKGNLEEAKKFATPSTGMLLDMFGGMAKTLSDSNMVNKNYEFIFIKDSIVKDQAWVTYKRGADKNVEVMDLKKIDGKWKADAGMK